MIMFQHIDFVPIQKLINITGYYKHVLRVYYGIGHEINKPTIRFAQFQHVKYVQDFLYCIIHGVSCYYSLHNCIN